MTRRYEPEEEEVDDAFVTTHVCAECDTHFDEEPCFTNVKVCPNCGCDAIEEVD